MRIVRCLLPVPTTWWVEHSSTTPGLSVYMPSPFWAWVPGGPGQVSPAQASHSPDQARLSLATQWLFAKWNNVWVSSLVNSRVLCKFFFILYIYYDLMEWPQPVLQMHVYILFSSKQPLPSKEIFFNFFLTVTLSESLNSQWLTILTPDRGASLAYVSGQMPGRPPAAPPASRSNLLPGLRQAGG